MHLSKWQNTRENTAKRNEWNTLEPEIRNAPSVTAFKHKLILKIRPLERSIYSIPDPIGVPYLSQVRVRLSKLNLHKFKHNFKDTINPFCPANDGVENAGHFFLFYPSCYNYQRDLTRISVVLRPFVQISTLSNKILLLLLLYSDKGLPSDANKHVLELTLEFIHQTVFLTNKLSSVFHSHNPPPPSSFRFSTGLFYFGQLGSLGKTVIQIYR